MKKLLLLGLASSSLILGATSGSDCSTNNCSSSDACTDNISISWYNPRSVSFNPVLTEANSRYNWVYQTNENNNNENYNYSLGIKPFAQISNNSKELARYFTPNNQTSFQIREDGTGDVNSAFFLLEGASTDYSSDISFAPTRRAFGLNLDFKTRLNFFNRRVWLNINSAFVHARHNLNVTETNRTVDGTIDLPPVLKTACDAFENSVTHGKMSCCSTNKSGFDDIIVRLGYDFKKTERRVISGSVIASLPTRGSDRDVNLFSPVIGSQSFGLGAGLDFDQILMDSENCRVTFLNHANFRYMFQSNQNRTFDLTSNGNWSRYLIFAHQTNGPYVGSTTANKAIVGDSLLNLNAKVTPGIELNFISTLNLAYKRFNFELGYNVWYRQAEKVCLDNKKCATALNSWGILDVNSWNSSSTINSTSTGKINESLATLATNADSTFTTINETDLNMNSAAHPKAVSYSVFANGQYAYCDDTFVNLNFAYEIPQDRNAIEQLTLSLGLERQF